MNHSCNATARFHEVRNGTEHTVVVAAERDIAPGEEITINYGTNIWFICHCKEPSCAHRYLRRIAEE
jgi:SET domain-containing protein